MKVGRVRRVHNATKWTSGEHIDYEEELRSGIKFETEATTEGTTWSTPHPDDECNQRIHYEYSPKGS